jgi:dTDP-4-amino-4,6-dideoxygalactose transaminase
VTGRVPFLDLAAMTREVRGPIELGWRRVLESSRFIGGEAVGQFEGEWAAYCRVPHAVGVANGTDALRLTLTALGIGPGDEVIVPANTFVATAEAVVLAGATPRFADVCPDTLLLTPTCLEAAITSRAKAVIVVHLYGQMPDMDALCRAAGKAGLAVIEDAAQAHGATWRGRPAGSIGTAGCFSFYPGKNLGAFGDAGAVVTADAGLAGRIRVLRDHGRIAGSHYRHELVGTNSRLDALQAVVLSVKLARLDAWNEARRSIAARYHAALAPSPARQVAEVPGTRGAYHLAVVRVTDRALVQQRLAGLGVETQIHYPIPCHYQSAYQRFADGRLPAAEHAAAEVLSLPMFPHMTGAQVAQVCDAVRAAVPGSAVRAAVPGSAVPGREHRVA